MRHRGPAPPRTLTMARLFRLIFGEPLTVVMGLGIVLIVAGVLTVELGSQKAQDHEQEEMTA